MPEGDTIHHAVHRIRPLLEGRVPDALRTRHPRFERARWAERLAGRLGDRRRSAACREARVDSWRTTQAVSDEEDLAGGPCARCGTPIAARAMGDYARTAFWCPGCRR